MLRAEVSGRLQNLQKNPENIRNICILAHVDHGKTTLADSLVASNGIISQRQAGKIRYLDSREDEQLRGITMKSSAIALQFVRGHEEYLINLIDSPGHVDFSSEVSTAVRLCDGAIVVVDVAEGVCPQTQTVLQQAWMEGIKPCLVLNKIDRLITELKYTPTEAYYHLQQVLEQVNAVTGALFTSEIMQAAADEQAPGDASENVTNRRDDVAEAELVYDWSAGLEDTDDSSLYFSPEHNNVIFASALDGWGFGVSHFAELYAKKLGIQADILRKTLWGDFFLNTKTKRIYKGAQVKGKKPLFVQFVLENMWAVYDAVLLNRDKTRIEKIVSSMNLKISVRDSRHTDPRIHLFAICSQWLPLATATLGMVVDQLPSPLQLTSERVEKLMCSSAKTFDSFPRQTQQLKEDFTACSPDASAPTVVFISKLFMVDRSSLPQHRARPLTKEEMAQRREAAIQRNLAKSTEQTQTAQTEDSKSTGIVEQMQNETATEPEESGILLAFSRVYSGMIHRGQTLFVLHPRYDPREVDLSCVVHSNELPPHVSKFTVGDLYILMGREVFAVEEVPAGNVLGIAGLEDIVLKSATVASSLACPAFRPMSYMAAPIVHVAIEPVHASDMPALVRGMKLLNQADPCVEVMVQGTGEHILSTAGEVHLKKCLDDLRDQYSLVELNVSAPIIPFRETVIPPPKIDMVNEAISSENEVKLVTSQQLKDATNDSLSTSIQTANKACTLQILAKPLLPKVTELLEKNSHLLRTLNLLRVGTSSGDKVTFSKETLQKLHEFRSELHSAFVENTDDSFEWEEAVDNIWSFGPRNTGPNVLLNGLSSYKRPSIWSALESNGNKLHTLRDYDSSIVSGFQLASLSGPLCEEPMHGLCFILKEWSYSKEQGKELKKTEPRIEMNDTSRGIDVPEDVPSSPLSPQPQLQTADIYGPFSGQLISAMKEGCRRAFLAQPARLMAAMYTCNILATAEVLGRLYAVLGRRNGRVLAEEMKEGSAVFSVQALVPVAESFGFAEEVRKKTSGLASPQLVFSHWELITSDPFWVPSTEEELLHFGEKADSENIARRYMNGVRKRKGLPVEEKIVEHAEKQRTLKKNK